MTLSNMVSRSKATRTQAINSKVQEFQHHLLQSLIETVNARLRAGQTTKEIAALLLITQRDLSEFMSPEMNRRPTIELLINLNMRAGNDVYMQVRQWSPCFRL